MSFGNHARAARDPSLPYGIRVSALRSCVQQYQPLGWHATLGFLEEVAGPFQRDEDALLRALDILDRSRRSRSDAQRKYAERRRQEKAKGQRAPRRGDPDPTTLRLWFGKGVRPASLHALRYEARPGGRLFEVKASSARGARELTRLAEASLGAGGWLSIEQRRQVDALLDDLHGRTSRQAHDNDPNDARVAWNMLTIVRLLRAASDIA